MSEDKGCRTKGTALKNTHGEWNLQSKTKVEVRATRYKSKAVALDTTSK